MARAVQKTIMLFATELASLVGQNPYEPVERTFLKAFVRNFPTSHVAQDVSAGNNNIGLSERQQTAQRELSRPKNAALQAAIQERVHRRPRANWIRWKSFNTLWNISANRYSSKQHPLNPPIERASSKLAVKASRSNTAARRKNIQRKRGSRKRNNI